MFYTIRAGTIKPERLATWTENKNPFDILENYCEITGIGGMSFLSKAKAFTDKTVVDWGSIAYRTDKKTLQKFAESTHCSIKGLDELPEEGLGVVIIETSEFIDDTVPLKEE